MKKNGIFIKVFTYTMILTTLFVFVTGIIFSRQFMSFFGKMQSEQSQVIYSFSGLFNDNLPVDASKEDVINSARQFHENNSLIEFYVVDAKGNLVYKTPNIDIYDDSNNSVYKEDNVVGYSFVLQNMQESQIFHSTVVIPIIVISIGLFVFCFVCSFVFARQITRPIEQLADDTHKMANLEDVPKSEKRNDEIGGLSEDVHSMYDKLKETIKALEKEILREQELEETQRYFFKMASHELKTPIASTSILLEGMLENIGDYKNHQKYLQECIKLMDSQSELVSDILTISNLNDSKIRINVETLNIKSVVCSVLENYYTLIEAKELNVIVDINEYETFVTDIRLFDKAISNIIVNAIQNTPQNNEVLIYTKNENEQVRLCVLNKGVKINEEVMSNLFDSFYRVDKVYEKSGLGLTIVKKTLDSLNLKFDIENAEDGVLFWIDLEV